MKETSNTTMNEEDATETNAHLDESTRDVLDDYSRKLLSLIQQEKERIRKQAIIESDKLLAEAERKARLVYEKAVKNAEAETNAITANCAELALKISTEADRISRIMVVLKEKTDHQIAELNTHLRQEAESIAESIRRSDKTASEIKAKLDAEFSESVNLIADLKLRLQTLNIPLPDKEDTLNTVTSTSLPASREDRTIKISRKEERPAARQPEKTFVGTLNFEVHKGTPALSRRFREALAKVPGLEISLADDSSKDKLKIVAFANRPLALLGILQQMTIVKSVVGEEGDIEVVLQDADRWIG